MLRGEFIFSLFIILMWGAYVGDNKSCERKYEKVGFCSKEGKSIFEFHFKISA